MGDEEGMPRREEEQMVPGEMKLVGLGPLAYLPETDLRAAL